ncbi:MAG: hypothetical protein HFE81_04510 [Bacilli bacterium]|nr:hypothetical protein [Bacilli bacterium]
MKEKYIALIKEKFTGPSQELLLKQVNLFYQENKNILTNKYSIGDKVKLTKGTFLHGIFGELENFDYTIENGFISTDFTDESRANKICNSVGMWNIQKDCLLKDYINDYSGFTITYTIGRGPGSKEVSKLIPYHQFDEFTENINNVEEIWTYWGTKTKEVSFLPSLVSEKRQIAFILNMDSLYAQELATADVWNPNLSEEILESFLDYRYYPKFLTERFNRTAATTDRESAIIFGLPSSLIEGVFVGRKIETNQASLDYIKNKLPNCYICNLDGVVIR